MLVLFMLGLLGLIILHGKKLSDYVKENISITVLLKEGTSDEMVLNLRQRFDKSGYIKSSRFITPVEAATELSRELGEDFVNFLGYNPLPPTLELQLVADYANSDSIAKIEKKLMSNNSVKEVIYQKSLIDDVNANIGKISLVILGFSLLLLIIAIILINNTIRLSIFSRRFLIRSMQLVGATESFITRPFVLRSMWHGLIAGLLAAGLLFGTLWMAQQRMPEIEKLNDMPRFTAFFGLIIALGILISAVSTWFAVRRFLRMKADNLYIN